MQQDSPVSNKRVSPIEEAMARVQNHQSETGSLLGRLSVRLAPVLGPPGPEGGDAAAGQTHSSPLHAELLERAATQEQINSHLESLLSRLSL